MKNITGRVEVILNGEILLTKTGAKAGGIGGYKRDPVMGSSGMHGMKEEAVPASVECSITDHDAKSLTALANLTGAVLVFSAVNGKRLISKNAFCGGDIALTEGEGEATTTFYGDPWEEQLG